MRHSADYYPVGGDGWWYCECCRKRTSEFLITDEWFEAANWILCPDCIVQAIKAYVAAKALRASERAVA